MMEDRSPRGEPFSSPMLDGSVVFGDPPLRAVKADMLGASSGLQREDTTGFVRFSVAVRHLYQLRPVESGLQWPEDGL